MTREEALALLHGREFPEAPEPEELAAEIARVRRAQPIETRFRVPQSWLFEEAERRLLRPRRDLLAKLERREAKLEDRAWREHLRAADAADRPPQHERMVRAVFRAGRYRLAEEIRAGRARAEAHEDDRDAQDTGPAPQGLLQRAGAAVARWFAPDRSNDSDSDTTNLGI